MPDGPLPAALWGIDLRHAALGLLDGAGRPCTIPELLGSFYNRGLAVEGRRPAKALADALAHEARKGRAVRVSRGRYQLGTMPSRTRRRIRRRLWLTPHRPRQPHP
ncbi:MAG: hypothetical protein ACRDWW_09500, partial [Acidimicrobiales bacterium]